MYCPNCGKDCGEFKFCPDCGTRMADYVIKEAQEQSHPNCGKDCEDFSPCQNGIGKSKQSGYENKNTKKGTTDIPTSGGYLGVCGSVVLSDSAVSVCVKSLFKKHRTWIPYDQLIAVVYKRPSLKSGKAGTLLFRGEVNKHIPIPGEENMGGDLAAVTVPPEKDLLFYHLFYMLKTVAPPTARFEMIVPPVRVRGLDEAEKLVDMEYFYNMYAPYRDRAASGIVAKHELKPVVARVLVDKVFDEKQRQMYEADPLDAIRDLNLVVADIRREQQRINRADAERRKRYERERVAKSLESLERKKTIEMLDDYLEKRGR